MSKTVNLSFDGGVVVAPGGETTSTQVHTVFLHEITITDAGQESHIYALFDKNRPTASAPFFEPVSSFNLAEWCIRGDAIQVDLSEVMDTGTDRYSGLLQDLTLSNDQISGMYARECTLRTMVKRGTTGVRFAWFGLYLIMDQTTSITYLATPVYNNPTTLDVPDHKVQVEQTDNPNYLAYKIMGDGSTVSVDVVRENALGQPIDPFLRISASKNIDVIKWSDVLAAENKSVFEERIQADIAAGIEPVLLDDVDPLKRIATLSGRNTYINGQQVERFSVFRTATNESNFTEYVPGKGTSELSYLNTQLKNGAAAYDPDVGLVTTPNNRNSTYAYTGLNTLDFVVSPIDGMAANFAVKITSTSQTDGTVTVYKKANGIYTPLKPSVAGGTTVEAGKTYQLTCVGDCWTLAEFEEPAQEMFTIIGGKRYKTVKIGSLYWMAENLDYNFSGLISPATDDSETDPVANYYNGDSSTYGSNGLQYNGAAVLYLQEHRAELGLGSWRVPTTDDFNALFTAVGGASTAATKLKSTSGWDSGYEGTDDYGFAALGAGNFTALYTNPVSGFNYMNAGKAACFATCTEDGGNIYNCTLWQDSGEPQMRYPAPKYVGSSIRLCMDA